MKRKNLIYLCLLIAISFGVSVSAQNVTIDEALIGQTITNERVVTVNTTTNIEERLANIAADPQLQQAYDEKVANSNSTSATPEAKTVTIERNLSNLNLNIDKSQFENNGVQRRQNFDFEQYRATIGNNVSNLKGN